MKKINFKSLIAKAAMLSAAALVAYSCGSSSPDPDPDPTPDPVITAVATLTAPANNHVVQLSAATTTKVAFSWGTSGTGATYKVAFYSAATGGEALKNQTATTNSVEISFADLASIATTAGIGENSSVDVWWNVIAVKGTTDIQPTATRNKITIKKSNTVPEGLYFGGAGTEYADKAIKMKTLADGSYEIYTKLKTDGGFNFTYYAGVENEEGVKYTATEGALAVGDAAITSYAADKVYLIEVNKTKTNVSLKEITKVDMWLICGGIGTSTVENGKIITIPYEGKGIWNKPDATTAFKANGPNSWDDDRFYFRVYFAGEETGVKYGWHIVDFNGGNTPTVNYAERDPMWFVTIRSDESADNAQTKFESYVWKIKFRGSSGQIMGVKLNLAPEEDNYYTFITPPAGS